MKKYTSIQIAKAIIRADKMGAERGAGIMADMKTQLDKRGDLSDRQWEYLGSLITEHSQEALDEYNEYAKRFATDQEYRERVKVIANYYIGAGQYYTKTAVQALIALKHHGEDGCALPQYSSLRRMLYNKYADKVWDSYTNSPIYSAGDLVQIRSAGVSRIWSQRKYTQEKMAGIENLSSHACLIIKVDALPISVAIQYKPKRGGARVYSVMPVGSTLIYHILECDLKKNRMPKTKRR
tara:strand:- start:561 stop:1274 length:714 start_codon:yes stop_codon:yes gene_type:complete